MSADQRKKSKPGIKADRTKKQQRIYGTTSAEKSISETDTLLLNYGGIYDHNMLNLKEGAR